MQDHPRQERGSETVRSVTYSNCMNGSCLTFCLYTMQTRPNKYLYEELSALALSEPSHVNERGSTSKATSVTGPAVRMPPYLNITDHPK